MSEWRTIDSAPKDGSAILMFGRLRGNQRQKYVVGYWQDRSCGEWVSSPGQYQARQITHWMPLPDPPADGAP